LVPMKSGVPMAGLMEVTKHTRNMLKQERNKAKNATGDPVAFSSYLLQCSQDNDGYTVPFCICLHGDIVAA
jgi:hypothetical protein